MYQFVGGGLSNILPPRRTCESPCLNAETINDTPRQYMNHLSDLLFVLSRVLKQYAGESDMLWEKERQR